MKREQLVVRVEKPDAATVIYHLTGDLHGTAKGYEFQEEVREMFATGIRRVLVNLSEIRRIDSCGIGILAATAMSAQNAEAAFVLTSLPPRIREILGITQFLKWVDHADTVPEAMTKLDQMQAEPE